MTIETPAASCHVGGDTGQFIAYSIAMRAHGSAFVHEQRIVAGGEENCMASQRGGQEERPSMGQVCVTIDFGTSRR
jgi:hypothetical protein